MARGAAAGNRRELLVAAALQDEGWCVASRRHIGGAGDLLAVRLIDNWHERRHEILLVEVKSTAGGPYERFGPASREQLAKLAKQIGAEAWLYWFPPRGELVRIPTSEWPEAKVAA